MERQRTCLEEVKAAVVNYSATLIKVAFTYLKNMQDAEDAVQDVFVIYMTKAPRFESEEHKRNWLMRCTINKCKDTLRSVWYKKRETLSEEVLLQEQIAGGSSASEYETAFGEEDSEVLQMVLSLDVKYRIPLHLHYVEGYSIKEIADMLHKKPATVGTLLSRGREKLKRGLA